MQQGLISELARRVHQERGPARMVARQTLTRMIHNGNPSEVAKQINQLTDRNEIRHVLACGLPRSIYHQVITHWERQQSQKGADAK